jgi:hypothetical protein
VIIAKMRTAHVPVKVLCFYIQGKDVCQQRSESVRNILDRLWRDIGVLSVSCCSEQLLTRASIL